MPELQTTRIGLAVGLLALLAAAPASAQFSPFGSQRRAAGLTKADSQSLFAAAEQLNGKAGLAEGDAQAWTNSKSGNSGNVTATKLFTSGGLSCHALRYDITFKSNATPRTYKFNWCKTPAGDWKIKD
jgi:surface antigen